MPFRRVARFAVAVGLLMSAGSLRGDHRLFAAGVNDVTSGDFIIDPPTLINLGFEWFVNGDDNRNAQVAVTYRRQGESQWKNALPLLRLQRRAHLQRRATGCRVAKHVCRQHPGSATGHAVRACNSCCPIRTARTARPGKW